MRKTVQLDNATLAKKIKYLQENGGGTPGEISAEDVSFDKTGTQLTATDVQAAIEELDDAVMSVDESLSDAGNHFYYMEKDGEPGWTLDEERAEENWHPFNGGGDVSITGIILEAAQVTDVTEKTYDREGTRGTHVFDRGEGLYTYYQSGNLGGEEWVVIDFGAALKLGFVSFTQLVATNVDNVDLVVSGSNDGEEFTEITTIEYAEGECKGVLSGTYRYLKFSGEIAEGKCLTIKKMLIATVE